MNEKTLKTQTGINTLKRLMLGPIWSETSGSPTDIAAEVSAAKRYFAADIAKIKAMSTDEAKVRAVNALICDTYFYSAEDQNAGGCWTNTYPGGEMSGKGIACAGYAAAADWMFNEVGIPSFITDSPARNHAWNNVLVDNVWYAYDGTVDGKSPENNASLWSEKKLVTIVKKFDNDLGISGRGILVPYGFISSSDDGKDYLILTQIFFPSSIVGDMEYVYTHQ